MAFEDRVGFAEDVDDFRLGHAALSRCIARQPC